MPTSFVCNAVIGFEIYDFSLTNSVEAMVARTSDAKRATQSSTVGSLSITFSSRGSDFSCYGVLAVHSIAGIRVQCYFLCTCTMLVLKYIVLLTL